MTTLEDALLEVVGRLNRGGVRYMIVGGLAVPLWGEPRGTRDIDVLVDLDGPSIVDLARDIGSPRPREPVEFAERARVLPALSSTGIPVEFLIATVAFEFDALSRAVEKDVRGIPVRFCSAQDLVVYKVVSERARDLQDVVGILKAQEGSIDLRWIDERVALLADDMPQVAERWSRARAEAGV